jgi:hypothetical protein
MPQFDTFSFFSQLFWVFLGFGYLYLVLCFYVLPSFAAILKVRARKLSVKAISSDNVVDVVKSTSLGSSSNSVFFEDLSNDLNVDQSSMSNNFTSMFSYTTLKNEAFFKFNFLLLNNYKTVQAYI